MHHSLSSDGLPTHSRQNKDVRVRNLFGNSGEFRWSSSWSECEFKCLLFSCSLNPLFIAERGTPFDAILDRILFLFRYRLIHSLNPAGKTLDWPRSKFDH